MMLALLIIPILAGSPDPRPALPPAPELKAPGPSWNGNEIYDYLNRQHECTLNSIEAILRQARPAYPEPKPRRLAMLALDEVMHYDEPDSNMSAAVKDFLETRTRLAANEMAKTRVRKGAVVWKLYNHAFVVSTPSATIAFDLTRGYWGRSGNHADIDPAVQTIIDRCDALFISHNHDDHLDTWVRDAFLGQGKPVVAPADVYESEKRIVRLSRDPSTKQVLTLKSGKKLEVVVFPGYQGDTKNNVTLVYTPEGMSFAHTGDLFSSSVTPEDQWLWIDRVKDRWKVDVLMVNVWTSDLKRTVDGFGPKLVITGHENELGHDPLKRKTNYLAYDRLRDSRYPWVVMTWGESYWYSPAP